ncbi:MAG: hypothetical protein OSJ70_04935 [Bacilli bacterium]|nr:hypothetical protein [Bacilli bacterium]
MTKKKETKDKAAKVTSTTTTEEIVLVRVINNFNDATDNERFISAGPNTFYRTNKSRADKLVAAGYAEYEDIFPIQPTTEVVDPAAQVDEDPAAQVNDDEIPNE